MERKPFVITDRAGLWVAGMRNPGAGSVIMLTDEQAEYEMLRGLLVPQSEEAMRAELDKMGEPRTAVIDEPVRMTIARRRRRRMPDVN